jgi:hypothetical protein
LPYFAGAFERRKTLKGFNFASNCGRYEIAEVGLELPMAAVMLAFDSGVLNRAAYPFDLAIGPKVLDPVLLAPQVEKKVASFLMRPNKTALSSSMASKHSACAG